jgi:hypothetical protein
MKGSNLIRAGVFVGAMLLFVSLPARALAAGTADVTVASQPTVVSGGQPFSVYINVSPNGAIAGAQFTLSFNPSLVTASSVTEGNLLKQGGANTYFLHGQIDNQVGRVSGVAAAIMSPGQSVSSAGTLAIIAMTAKSTSGTSALNLSAVIVGDITGKAVPANVANGQVGVAGANAAPVLTSIGNKSVTAGQVLQFIVSATDANGDSLTYSAYNLPSGATFDASAHAFSWLPSSAQVGQYPGVRFQVSDGSLTASESITIAVVAPVAPPAGGGGGGGLVGGGVGGGGGAPAGPGVTNLIMYTNGAGLFNLTATASSDDGKAQLEISKGVQANAKDGTPLKSVSISKASDPGAASADQAIVGSAYDFGPDAAVFSPPITISLSYDLSLVPEGLNEKDLVIAVWDQTAGKWIGNNSTIDTTGPAVKAAVSHFSRYAVIAQARPAAFTVGGLKINPERANINEPVAIAVTVSNSGDVSGSHDVLVNVSPSVGSEVLNQEVQVPGGASREVEFTVTKDSPGLFNVTVDGLSGSFTVEPKASPGPTTAAPGPMPRIGAFASVPTYGKALSMASIGLTYQVVNPGAETTEAKLVLKVGRDGQPFDEAILFSGNVTAGRTANGSLDYIPSSGWTSGTYTFLAELYSDGSMVASTAEQTVDVNDAKPATVSWYILAIIIGSTLLASFVMTVLVLRRRRALFRTWAHDGESISK